MGFKRRTEKIGIAPGVVAGSLQYDRHLPYSHFNDLKVRYEWDE
ncbi:MAG: hypothetical protein ACK2UT_02840 [Candidatus Promineifilaceae bacterium]|jgi:hypothetical protein